MDMATSDMAAEERERPSSTREAEATDIMTTGKSQHMGETRDMTAMEVLDGTIRGTTGTR